ncbi:hypothetical protein [Candidatus Nitrospira nitrificans]|uniref:Uncharacterized protein n=1 Tax=Candidatus Nitrospira nitrificans TaxID=1742973 RepID=A0A0S4LMS1_9BACT|nr:hypothetical protein [Candidatus Nitrospira nitrificans]CUS37227.1 hypothetical protein COMA2_30137 [Candidatus Nitrospira nitrificans]
MLLDLLTEEEADDRRKVFDIGCWQIGCYRREAGWKQNLGPRI